jgi:hypothetical protein
MVLLVEGAPHKMRNVYMQAQPAGRYGFGQQNQNSDALLQKQDVMSDIVMIASAVKLTVQQLCDCSRKY